MGYGVMKPDPERLKLLHEPTSKKVFDYLSHHEKVFCQMYFMPHVHSCAPPLMPHKTNYSSASTGGRVVENFSLKVVAVRSCVFKKTCAL